MYINDSISFEDVNITYVLSKGLLDFQENVLCSNDVHIDNDFGNIRGSVEKNTKTISLSNIYFL